MRPVGKIPTNNHPSQLRFPRHHSYFPAGCSLNLDSLSSTPAFCTYCSLCVKRSSCREPDGTSLSTFSHNQEVFPSHLYKNGTQSTSWYYLVSFCREFPCDSVCLVSPSVLSQPPECKLIQVGTSILKTPEPKIMLAQKWKSISPSQQVRGKKKSRLAVCASVLLLMKMPASASLGMPTCVLWWKGRQL